MDSGEPIGGLAGIAVPAAAGGRIEEIEVLRGVAILSVMTSHAQGFLITTPIPIWDRITRDYVAFWPGVDLFFAISGFVIARSLLPALEACHTAESTIKCLLVFWIRRAWRLLPASWLWLGLILVATLCCNRSGVFGSLRDGFEGTMAAMLSLANIRFWLEGKFLNFEPTAPYWSLSLEEQFYFCLPLLAVFVRARLVPVLVLLLAIVAVLPISLLLVGVMRIQAILLGVLLAIAARQPAFRLLAPRFLGRSAAVRLSVGGFLLLGIGSMAPLRQTITPNPFDGIAVLSAILVFIASFDKGYLCGPGTGRRIMTWIGARSYALYLTHVPAYLLMREILFRAGIADTGNLRIDGLLLAGGVSLAFLFAVATHRLVEVPFRRRGRRIAAAIAP